MKIQKIFLMLAGILAGVLVQAGTDKSLRISKAGTEGEMSERFFVMDVPGKMPGEFSRPDVKFTSTAAQFRAEVSEDSLDVYITCGHPAGMEPECGEKVWLGDHIEFFIQPAPLKSTTYFQYVVNADGETFFAKYSTSQIRVDNWKSCAASSVKKDDNGYYVSLHIPKKELEGADWSAGADMRGNVIRTGRTGGGVSCWSYVEGGFHDLGTFGVLIVQSRLDYFKRRLEPMKTRLAESRSAVLKEKADEILARADDPRAWNILQKRLRELELSLLQETRGKTILWRAPVWDDGFRLDTSVKPMQELKLVAARNSRIITGLAFSNLTERPFMGQLKYLSRFSLKYMHEFNRLPFDETLDFARHIRLFEAIPLRDLQNMPKYEPLVPLPLQTLIRCNPHDTVPLFLSIDTRGLKPGIYQGVFYLKPAYAGFQHERFDFSLEVLDVDLSEVEIDNYVWTHLINRKKRHLGPNITKFMVEHEFNVLEISSIGFQLECLPEVNENGDVVKLDWTDFDNVIDSYTKAGMPLSKLKLLIAFGQMDRGLILAGTDGKKRVAKWSPAWEKGVKAWVRLLGDHLEKKYGISRTRWWFYPWDEPNGDPADDTSTSWQAVRFAKLFKEADPQCRTWANPYDWKDNADAERRLKGLAPWFDALSPNRSYLTNPEVVDLFRKTGREIWTYSVLSNRTSPIYYRAINWFNQRDGFSGPAAFYHLDCHSGEDGFDPTDGGNHRVDYGVSYPDFGADEILTSRRLEAHFMGHLDRKAMNLCTQLIGRIKAAGLDVSAEEKELHDLILKGCSSKNMDDFQELHSKLLRLALQLQKKKE